MMRSMLVVAVLPLISLSSVAASAAKEPGGIAYVDMNRALNTVEDGKEAKARLKKEFEGRQKKLDELQAALKKDQEDFEKRKGMMNADARAAKEEELQRKFIELQQTYMTLQKELIGEESKSTQEIAGKLRTIVARIGDRDSYEAVLDIGDSVLYFKRHKEITDQVIKEYNEQYRAKK